MALEPEQHTKYANDGFLCLKQLIPPEQIIPLHKAFDDLFAGHFETGTRPDEVNWQCKDGDPTLTRQICNGWKANRTIARTVLNQKLGALIGELTGWPGVRIMQDNVLWKPPGAKSLSYHQDSAYLSWFTPNDLCSVWIGLDETHKTGGTLEFARGSHRWPLSKPEGEFHAPAQYRSVMERAADKAGASADIHYVEVPAGGGSIHHGHTWHGSGLNAGTTPRRAVVLHAMRSDTSYVPECLGEGIGPIYSRYKRLGDNLMDENHFPVLWREDGYRTPGLDAYIDEKPA